MLYNGNYFAQKWRGGPVNTRTILLIGSEGTEFNLSVTIGRDLTFSTKHGKLDKISKSTATENTTTKKKYVSPSTHMRD